MRVRPSPSAEAQTAKGLEAGAEEGMRKVRPLPSGISTLLILGLLQLLMEPGKS